MQWKEHKPFLFRKIMPASETNLQIKSSKYSIAFSANNAKQCVNNCIGRQRMKLCNPNN